MAYGKGKQMCRSPKGYSTKVVFNKNSDRDGLVVKGYKGGSNRDSQRNSKRGR